MLAERLNRKVEHLFLTPIKMTVPFIQKSNGLVITGDRDPLFTKEDRRQIETASIHLIEDADHGLESHEWTTTLAIMQDVLTEVNKYFLKCLAKAEGRS